MQSIKKQLEPKPFKEVELHKSAGILDDYAIRKDIQTRTITSGKFYGEGIIPTGSIIAYGNATAPTGFLLCDGTEVSRTTYSDLFAIVGTSFGAGDTTTTFNLPNLVTKFPRGNSTAGGTGGATTHAHVGCTDNTSLWNCMHCTSGYICGSSVKVPADVASVTGTHNHQFTTGTSSSIPPYQDVVWIIKT